MPSSALYASSPALLCLAQFCGAAFVVPPGMSVAVAAGQESKSASAVSATALVLLWDVTFR